MEKAFKQFENNIKEAKELGVLFDFLKNIQKLPNDFTDILRAQMVYGVSALDKLIHELIRIGMIQSFLNNRPKTEKFNAFPIPVSTYEKIMQSQNASSPLGFMQKPEYWFEQLVIMKNKSSSYQEPAKIADGLSLIWDEPHKWQKIGSFISISGDDLKKQLKSIIDRRNLIVHEADVDVLTATKNKLDIQETNEAVDLIFKIGDTIYNLVKL